MSLYVEAAAVLEASIAGQGTLKSITYSRKPTKNKAGQVYALVSQATKWAVVLKEVVERSGLLEKERKISPALALLLSHDLLLAKTGVAAAANHPLKLAIIRHQVRLRAELTKYRVRRRIASLDELRAVIEREAASRDAVHPRWVRINSVRTTLEAELATTFSGFTRVGRLEDVLSAEVGAKVFHVDETVPLLLALPARTDVTSTDAYKAGRIILQDKASCFPAVLLADLDPGFDVVDGCAAPGNKTSQLGELAFQIGQTGTGRVPAVIAFERDRARAGVLGRMIDQAGLNDWVTIRAGADFLQSDPASAALRNVSTLLLDPSCSGSGIVGRDGGVSISLPGRAGPSACAGSSSGGRSARASVTGTAKSTPAIEVEEENADGDLAPEALADRLAALSAFQVRVIEHAMSFPAARRISYSTCSVHPEENEDVVGRVLQSSVAKQRGWAVWARQTQPSRIKQWGRRGLAGWADSIRASARIDGAGLDLDLIADSCVRCAKDAGSEGTMGFFLAGFVRTGHDDRIRDGSAADSPDTAGTDETVDTRLGPVIGNPDGCLAISETDETDETSYDDGDEWAGMSD